MADNSVFIAGVADGAFENALGELPPWATEKTAFTIEGILRKSLGIQTKMLSEAVKGIKSAGSGSLSPDDAKKVNNELDKLFKNLKRENEEGAKTKKRNKDLEKDDKESLARGKKLNSTNDKLTYVLTGLATVGNKVLGVQEQYIDTYDSLYKSGINVLNGNNSTADGFEALNQLVNQTGLRLQTLQKVAEKYSSTMNVVGMSKFGKALAMSVTQMKEYGFSQEASAELTAAMLESEKGYSDIRGKTEEQIAAGAQKLGQQFSRLSVIAGISREQLQENLKSTSKTISSAMVSAKYGIDAAAKLNASVAGIKDSGLRETFMQLAAAANPAQVKGYNDLVNAGLGDVAQQMHALSKAGMSLDPAAFATRLSAFTEGLEKQTGRMGNLANLLGAGGEEAATMLNSLYQAGRDISKASPKQIDAAVATQASIAKLQTETEKLSAAAQAAFFPMVSQVNLVADSMKKLNDALYGVIGAVNAETRSWIGVGLIIAGFGAAILAAVKSVDTFMSLFGKGGSVIGRAVSGIGSVLGRIGSIFLRFAGPVAAIYAAFQLGTSIGETIYEMLTGVKNSINYFEIITDIIKDAGSWISDTFTTFKNWVSGGIDSFTTGIKNMGNAVLEFAPWLKTIGGYISGTVNFFKTIFTEVSSFIDSFVGVLATLVKGVASKFANKMSFGLVGSDTSDFVTDKASSPTKISVPKTPMASTIASPSAVEVQPPKVPDANAPGPTAATIASTAMAKPDSKSDINSMLTFQSTLLEQILLSSNSLVSVNKEILRYTRNNA